jgi:hypothetical protein
MDQPEHRTHDKTWAEDRAFEGNGMRVLVNKLPLNRRPHYSIAVGRIAPDNGTMKFIPVVATGTGDQVDVAPVDQQLGSLLKQALDYIRDEIQRHERAWLAEMGDRPPSRDKGGPGQRPARNFGPDRVARKGKTERDRERRGSRGREG